VVKAVDINETAVVDGFTITKGGVGGIYCYYGSPTIRNNKISDSSYGKGIDCDHSDPNITNCIIQDNDNDGIYCNYSNPTIINCIIEDSDGDGIYCNYSNPTIINCLIQNCNQGLYCELYSSPVIANSIIRRNSRDGIKIRYSSASAATVIKNSWICDNGTVGGGDYSGIRLSAPGSATVIRNSTIANNLACGIWASSTGEELEVTNCIAWGNGTNPIYNLWGDFDKVAYCCVEGGYAGGDHIISNDPCFVDDANDNYHLKYDSLCEDAGDPNFNDSNETDIDGQPRNMGDCNETVDIGADEIYFPSCWNCRTQCHGDSDCSGFVDTRDFPPYRDGFMKSYPHPVYIANVCGDWKRDGIISTLDFPEYRDWFFKSPPADCDCGGCWPPGSCEGEGRGQSSGDTADEPSLEEMIDWLIEHDLPGCDEFIRRLYEQVETGS